MDSRLRFYLNKQLKEFEKLPKRVRQEIENQLDWIKCGYTTFVQKCESPIEQLLAIHLDALEKDLYRDSVVLKVPFVINFYTQKEVEVNDKTYRLDFLIDLEIDGKSHKFAIECDGHDFHEKTKEQARRDKQRDRDLTANDYTVIRFTGSEIYEDPSSCAGEVSKIIYQVTGIDRMYAELVQRDLYGE